MLGGNKVTKVFACCVSKVLAYCFNNLGGSNAKRTR
jgi:hypothetical protein